jgi:hypothetical protein
MVQPLFDLTIIRRLVEMMWVFAASVKLGSDRLVGAVRDLVRVHGRLDNGA